MKNSHHYILNKYFQTFTYKFNIRLHNAEGLIVLYFSAMYNRHNFHCCSQHQAMSV